MWTLVLISLGQILQFHLTEPLLFAKNILSAGNMKIRQFLSSRNAESGIDKETNTCNTL